MSISKSHWRNCSQCKKELPYKTRYYECSVSTCSRKRTGYVFCSILCWEAHVPGANHRNAGAIEKIAPSYEAWVAEDADLHRADDVATGLASTVAAPMANMGATSGVGQRRIIATPAVMKANTSSSSMSNEVLVVVSKMKQYIKDCSDMNTSGDVNEILSDLIRRACDKAIERARADGRKTVMARDFT